MNIKIFPSAFVFLILTSFSFSSHASFIATVACGGPFGGNFFCDASPFDHDDADSGAYSYHWSVIAGRGSVTNNCNQHPDGSFICAVNCKSSHLRVQVTVTDNSNNFSDTAETSFSCSENNGGGF